MEAFEQAELWPATCLICGADLNRKDCPVCNGSKSLHGQPCDECNGFGWVWYCPADAMHGIRRQSA